MRRPIILASVILLMVMGAATVAQESSPRETLAMSVTVQVVASDPEMTSRAIASWADEVGGYYTYRSNEQVLIRIRPERFTEVRGLIESLGDTVVAYNPGAVDHREAISRNEAAIRSRTEALDRILEYIRESNVTATLSFERELRSLLEEIEYFTGLNNRMQNEIDFATATINLSSRQRTIPEQRPSTFAWINTVDLYRFLGEVRR